MANKSISTTMPTLGHHIVNVKSFGDFGATKSGKGFENIVFYDKANAEEIKYRLFDGFRVTFFNQLFKQSAGNCVKHGREDSKVLDYFKEFDLELWCDCDEYGLQVSLFPPKQ